jgi:hypothetical protein
MILPSQISANIIIKIYTNMKSNILWKFISLTLLFVLLVVIIFNQYHQIRIEMSCNNYASLAARSSALLAIEKGHMFLLVPEYDEERFLNPDRSRNDQIKFYYVSTEADELFITEYNKIIKERKK